MPKRVWKETPRCSCAAKEAIWWWRSGQECCRFQTEMASRQTDRIHTGVPRHIYAEHCLQILATLIRGPEPLQKSQRRSPTRPFAHEGQIHAMSLLVVFLQKSHHLSPVCPSAHFWQMTASTTWWENFLQKLHRCAVIRMTSRFLPLSSNHTNRISFYAD